MEARGARRVVVDCSTYLFFLLPDEANTYAEAVFAAFKRGELRPVVPNLFFLEAAHALLGALRKRKRISETQHDLLVEELADFLLNAEICPFPDAPADLRHMTRLARRHDLSAYDASYLALALALDAPLATLDAALARAAGAEGAYYRAG